MIFYFPHKCTIQRETQSQAATGQIKKTWTDHLVGVDCLVRDRVKLMGTNRDNIKAEFEVHLNINFEGFVDIKKDDKVINVISQEGTVLYPEIFTVTSVKRVTDFSGAPHHTSAQVMGA